MITCNNSFCKHNNGEKCSTKNISISNNKCDSFEYKNVWCVICMKEITIMNILWGINGIDGELIANFGSKFDGNVYHIAICDNCIEKLKLEPKSNFL